MNAFFFSRVSSLIASATPEFGTSKIASTLSASYHWRAIAEPVSALFWWSAETISTFMPFFAAPKSSTARRAAATEPGPPMSAYRLDMSLRTPILITRSDTWAFAPVAGSATATAQLNLLRDIETPPLLNPEILLNAVHVRFQPVVRHHVDDAAMLDHVVAIGHRLREAEILLHQQQREALLLEAREHAADLLHQHRCQALGRLIEQQQLRAGAQDAADGEHLLLAARELGARAVQPLLEVREQFV